MKKYSVLLANLVLFSALFASGVAIGMEKELSELEPQVLGESPLPELPQLPPDVRKIIASKILRVILDEAEDKPDMLLEERKEEFTDWFAGIIPFTFERFTGKYPVDFIILLLQNGADPNTKNYKGNTVLHLLGRATISREYYAMLMSKFDLLNRYKINFNEKNASGETIAHCLLKNLTNLFPIRDFILPFLQRFNVDITIQDNNGETVCRVGQRKINDLATPRNAWEDYLGLLNDFCSRK